MKLYVAGGCGEHGRSCFLVTGGHRDFLVDCGVAAGEEDRYPHLSEDQIRGIEAVFLTHSHADHTGALQWLCERGYAGPVIASRHTLEQLPFHRMAEIALEEICPTGEGGYRGVAIRWGRSGHCVGSVWYHFSVEGKRLLFSGDYTEDTQVYVTDLIRGQTAQVAVLDGAYGYDDTSYESACHSLVMHVKELLERYSLLAFPVPRYGRGLELLMLLQRAGVEIPFFGDDHFMREAKNCGAYGTWFKEETPELQKTVLEYEASAHRGIVFISDPQLKNAANRRTTEQVLAHGGFVVLTGSVERDSYSARLQETGTAAFWRYPVHLNKMQADHLAGKNDFGSVILYHSAAIRTSAVCTF